jgi:hypothetical protein
MLGLYSGGAKVDVGAWYGNVMRVALPGSVIVGRGSRDNAHGDAAAGVMITVNVDLGGGGGRPELVKP